MAAKAKKSEGAGGGDGGEPFPVFPLFADPMGADVFKKSKKKCECCEESRGWIYTGPSYGDSDEVAVCPWCIADGSAAETLDCTFNDAGIIHHHPGDDRDPPEAEMDQIEKHTPGYVNWQGNCWFACCGHAAVYQGEASGADLIEGGRWAEAVPTVFHEAENVLEELAESMDELEPGGPVGVHVFKCPHCGKLGGYLDLE